MKHQDGTLVLPAGSLAAGAKLYTQSWLPEDDPKAIIILIHGYDEHSGRYQYFAEHCVAKGLAVYAIDHWGHGKSVGDNGFVPEFSVYLDGVNSLLASLADEHRELPKILVGHSLGGLIASRYLLETQQSFAAAVLSGPAIKAVEEPSALLKFISRLLSRIAPKMGVIALDANDISRDPEVVAKYLADPLVSGTKIGARLGREMMVTMEEVQEQAGKITLPMLLMHGDQDALAAPEGSQLLYDRISSTDKMLKFYPGLFHEIFNEPEKDAVLTDMTDWISGRFG